MTRLSHCSNQFVTVKGLIQKKLTSLETLCFSVIGLKFGALAYLQCQGVEPITRYQISIVVLIQLDYFSSRPI